MRKPYIIGVCGGTASGKTYFLERLQAQLRAEEATFISLDNYYRPKEEQPLDENNIPNFDTPGSINWQELEDTLDRLDKGETVRLKKYTFNNPLAPEEWIDLKPSPVWVIEGLFSMQQEQVRKRFDISLFMDTEEHLKIFRRIERDYAERGYDLKDVTYRYLHHAIPAYKEYVQPFRALAHVVIPNNVDIAPVVDLWAIFIRDKAKLSH
ncbi:MAG: phosphoribulokinase/uridine kinase [Chitinophagaceae bacterium]|nr:phosphoribulokinase/uridine kinase [Chitinophagaceae bacterium]